MIRLPNQLHQVGRMKQHFPSLKISKDQLMEMVCNFQILKKAIDAKKKQKFCRYLLVHLMIIVFSGEVLNKVTRHQLVSAEQHSHKYALGWMMEADKIICLEGSQVQAQGLVQEQLQMLTISNKFSRNSRYNWYIRYSRLSQHRQHKNHKGKDRMWM